jgi:carboxylesterase type B
MKPRRRLAAIAALVLPVAWVALIRVEPAVAAVGSPVVRTDKGAVQGVTKDGVDSYLGVRYARAPVGRLRWEPPQSAAPWPGVLQTRSFGNRCPQTPNSNGPLSLTEDCLFLNVQRPTGTASGQRLPVYVFIHGGGLLNGSASQHDGTSIVQQTGVIVVTINYRLGVLGWLGHPTLTAARGESGNGLKDQIAALGWVRRNIAAFGGDVDRVTVGGESAGAFSVCALLSAPAAAGLFSRAVMQSGYCDTGSQSDAEFVGRGVAALAGCSIPAQQLACLRNAPTRTLLTAWEDFGNPNFGVTGTPTLPLDLRLAILQNKIRHVPLLIGSNRDEGRTFSVDNVGLDKAGYRTWLQNNFFTPGQAAAVEARYPWPATANRFTAAYLSGAILTDGLIGSLGGCPYRDLVNDFAAVTTTFVYEFDHRTGPGVRPEPAGYVWGAGHAAELAYMWPSFDNGTPIAPTFDPGERRLSRQMIANWGAFVKNGRPAAAGQPAWPRFNGAKELISLRAGNASTLITDATFFAEHRCTFWGSVKPADRGPGVRPLHWLGRTA